MESRVIELTEATHKYGNLNIRPCGKEFFPEDVFGGSSKKAGLGTPITLSVEGLPETIKTDIPTDKKTKHPRWMFRERKWVKDFVKVNSLIKGDEVTIVRGGNRTYFIFPGRKSDISQLGTKFTTKKPDFGAHIVKHKRSSKVNVFLNNLFEGDCLDIMPDIPPNSIDMILCDLPYGNTQNKWDSIIPLDRLWLEYERIIKDKGAIVLTSQGLFTAKLILSNEKLFRYKIIWIKSKPTNFLNAKKQPLRKHEDICVFYKSFPTYNPQMSKGIPYNKGVRKDQFTGSYGEFKPVEVKSDGERYPTDVVYFKTAESEGLVWHPTQKPVDLGRYLIRTFTNSGDVVLDNAFGSGSFLVASLLEDRNFIGIEKNEEVHLFKKKPIDYVNLARKRLDEARRYIEQSNELFDNSTQNHKLHHKQNKLPTQGVFF